MCWSAQASVAMTQTQRDACDTVPLFDNNSSDRAEPAHQNNCHRKELAGQAG